MKKLIAIIIILATLVACAAPATQTKTAKENRFYAKTAMVIQLDTDSDVVTCVDGADNLWCFYGVEDWQTGDFASLLMDNNGTADTIYDDAIVEATYAGTFDHAGH